MFRIDLAAHCGLYRTMLVGVCALWVLGRSCSDVSQSEFVLCLMLRLYGRLICVSCTVEFLFLVSNVELRGIRDMHRGSMP